MIPRARLILIVICFFYAVAGFTQDNKEVARQLLEMADEIYNSTSAYIQARDAYVQVLDFDPENIKANFMAGYLFLLTINKERATPYLLKTNSIDPDYSYDLLYLIGRGYQYGLDFSNAIKYYNLYLDKLGRNPNYKGQDFVPASSVETRLQECQTGMQLISSPLNYNITNVGPAINSEWPDYAPTINRDETLMIFTSRRKDGNINDDVFEDNFPYEDIFISKNTGSEWQNANNISSTINSPFFESSLTLSKDGKQLYLYLDENRGDIFVSELRQDGSWSSPIPIEGSINTPEKETSVSISPDGNIIFFASDRQGTIGGTDIFYSEKDRRGRWTEIKNIGPVINTSLDDDFPFIDYDGKTLYFSSQGHNGMGGYDIFKTVYDSATGQWINPVNIGYPINTPDNDISFISTPDWKRGYFSSVREDGFGYQDIYMFTIPEEIQKIDEENKEVVLKSSTTVPVQLLVYIKDEKGDPVNAVVQLRNDVNHYLNPVSSQSVGIYSASVNNPVPKQYHISAEKDGYMFVNLSFVMPAASATETRIEQSLVLKQIRTGRNMVLRNIYFDFDKTELKQESFVELNKLYQMLSENSRIIAEIAGHTDNIGNKDYNYRLSYKRARVVVDYLVKKGIDPAKLKTSGYGEDHPMASNDNEKEGRELNRRVEFRVLRYLY